MSPGAITDSTDSTDNSLPIAVADRAQRRAAAADRSAWVAASAGSGKTKVLTDRVLSLLLAGTDPGHLLCLTFTKAAAAEMSGRITSRLAEWAVIDDDTLGRAVSELLGRQAHQDELLLARRLFAGVLDVPGGMKIQTVHGFCQSILRRFPLEAGVSPQFEVLDPLSSAELTLAASDLVLTQARTGREPALAAALAVINDGTSEGTFSDLIRDLIGARDKFEAMITGYGGPAAAAAAIYRRLGADPSITPSDVISGFVAGIAARSGDLAALSAGWLDGSKGEQGRGGILKDWLAADEASRRARYAAYQNLFLTAKGEPRSTLVTKATAERQPQLLQIVETECRQLLAVNARFNAQLVARSSAALIDLGHAVLRHYAGAKRSRDRLDYDDLILRTRQLLNRPGGPSWVLYKLDGGIDHILVDEAQDTNPAQWDIITKLAEAFFDRPWTPDAPPRTVFAVGDVKQSIFSFQGADPAGFHAMRQYFAAAVQDAGGAWDDVPMNISFRSAPAILAAVDAVFSNPDMAAGVVDPALGQGGGESAFEQATIQHVSARPEASGVVEIWSPVMANGSADTAAWAPPERQITEADPRIQLATQIAAHVRLWIDQGEHLPATGRPISAGDIMILVRRRDPLVEALSRAFKRQGIAVAGVDRMILTDQLAVMDLIALGEFLLLPEDDLTLATVLKSPLIGMSEGDLFDLAWQRQEPGLWRELRRRSSERDSWAAADRRLLEWLSQADQCPPHELFAGILAATGRRNILARLGADALDPIDEFLSQALAYEQGHVPSLQGFLRWLASAEFEVKRDLDADAGDRVRIMTVHGSKGLQAPVVFLPDTMQVPKSTPRLLWDKPPGEADLLLWPARSEHDDPRSSACRQAARRAQMAEYRRLLYVAMTRAEDRLYICGWHGKQRSSDSWYDAIAHGLQQAVEAVDGAAHDTPDAAAAPTAAAVPGQVLWRLADQPINVQPAGPAQPRAMPPDSAAVPPHFSVPPAPEPWPSRPLTPSRPSAEEPPVRSPLATADGDRFKRGLLIHKLLQVLPELPVEQRRPVAKAILARPVHGLLDRQQGDFLREVMAVLDNPDHGAFFGPQSRAEVPIVGQIGQGPSAVTVAGQIDRLAVFDTRVVILDYKTNRPAPAAVDDVPAAYRAQLRGYRDLVAQLYQDRPVECYLLWTDGPRLMRVNDEILDMGLR